MEESRRNHRRRGRAVKERRTGLALAGFVFWNIISTIILIAQVVTEFSLVKTIVTLDILPQRYLIIALVALGAALLISILLLFVKQSRGIVLRILRTLLAAVICVAIALVNIVSGDLTDTLTGSLKELAAQTHPSSVIGVYVVNDDPAQSLQDAKDYIFTYGEDFNQSTTSDAFYQIQDELGQTVQLQTQATVLDSIDALYAGTCGALLMNETYLDVLEDTAGVEGGDYSDFTSKARLLTEITVEDTEQPQTVEEEEKEDVDVTTTGFIVYLSGSDTRSEKLTTSRSDVNILAVVNPETHQILLVNTPRDYYVPISISESGTRDKLTHCGIYGIDCSMDTLSNLYGVDVNYYAQINFTGFEKLIDAVGGVTVYSDVAFNDIVVGDNHLNGEEALAFARERHALANGDNDRGQNQMKVIKALIHELSATNVLQNYSSIMASLDGMFVTDMTQDQITDLVKLQISSGKGWDVYSYAVTGTGEMNKTYSMPRTDLYVMVPDESTVTKASGLMQKVLIGELLTETDMN